MILYWICLHILEAGWKIVKYSSLFKPLNGDTARLGVQRPRFMISLCHTQWGCERSLTCEVSLEIKSLSHHLILSFSPAKTPCLESTVSPRIPKCQSSPQLDGGRIRAGLMGEWRAWKSCLDRQPQYLNLSVHMWMIQEAPDATLACRWSPGGVATKDAAWWWQLRGTWWLGEGCVPGI